MTDFPLLPSAQAAYADQGGNPTSPFYTFLNKLKPWASATTAGITSAAAAAATAQAAADAAQADADTAQGGVDTLNAAFYKTRQIATRCYVPSIFSSTNKQVMSRSRHRAQINVTSLKIEIPNYYVDGVYNGVTFNELATGATATVTASIEYPAGTFTQIKFSGTTSGTIASGSVLLSDSVTVTIPVGAFFFVRIFFSCSGGTVFHLNTQDSARGEATHFAASGMTDQTMSGTVTQSVSIPQPELNASMFGPQAIVAYSSKKAIALYGDSKMAGYNGDVGAPSYFNHGYIARAIGANLAYINAGIPGDQAQYFVAHHARRAALASYCDAAICGYGRNDLSTAVPRTAAQAIADVISIPAMLGIPTLPTTLSADTTSTDGFVTTVNQTVQAWEPQRLLFNANIRLENIEFADYIDTALVLESSLNSGFWPPGYTSDGVHENYTGCLAVRDAGQVLARLMPVLLG